MTDKEKIKKLTAIVDEAIDTCTIKKDIGGIPICRDNVVPCAHAINSGLCTAIIEAVDKYNKEANNKNDKDNST